MHKWSSVHFSSCTNTSTSIPLIPKASYVGGTSSATSYTASSETGYTTGELCWITSCAHFGTPEHDITCIRWKLVDSKLGYMQNNHLLHPNYEISGPIPRDV